MSLIGCVYTQSPSLFPFHFIHRAYHSVPWLIKDIHACNMTGQSRALALSLTLSHTHIPPVSLSLSQYSGPFQQNKRCPCSHPPPPPPPKQTIKTQNVESIKEFHHNARNIEHSPPPPKKIKCQCTGLVHQRKQCNCHNAKKSPRSRQKRSKHACRFSTKLSLRRTKRHYISKTV